MLKKKNKNEEAAESREERFKRIASRRVQDILEKLRLLGNCSDKSNYAYSDDQIKKIFSNIDNELRRVKALYNKSKSRDKFEL